MSNVVKEPKVAISSILFILFGMAFLAFGLYANAGYGEIPNYIVNDLNSGRDLEMHNGTILLLLDGGVFNVIDPALAKFFIVLGALSVYIGYFVHIHEKRLSSLGLLFTKEFWTTSSMFKFTPYKASKETLQAIAKEKSLTSKQELKKKASQIEKDKNDPVLQQKKAALEKIKKKA